LDAVFEIEEDSRAVPNKPISTSSDMKGVCRSSGGLDIMPLFSCSEDSMSSSTSNILEVAIFDGDHTDSNWFVCCLEDRGERAKEINQYNPHLARNLKLQYLKKKTNS